MALNKSLQAQHYLSEPTLLVDLQNHLQLWTCQLKKRADAVQPTHIPDSYCRALQKNLTQVEALQNSWHDLTITQCLRLYRANSKLQKSLVRIQDIILKRRRYSWQHISKLSNKYLPIQSRIPVLIHLIMRRKSPENMCRKVTKNGAIGDMLTLIDQLHNNKVYIQERPWRLSHTRKKQAVQTLIQNFSALVGMISQEQIITIPHNDEVSTLQNQDNPTTLYLRYNKHRALELSINSTKSKRASKLCGTHKDGSIHQVITLQSDNTLSGHLHYCVFYHYKKNFPHKDYLNPIFRTKNGVMHLPYGGKDLVETIGNQKLNHETQVSIILECILTLRKLHRSRRHHMDIKIDNVLVNLTASPLTVTIIDIPHNLQAGEKIGYMITAWHSILPKKIPSDKNCPSKRGILNQTGAQVFHDCFAITQIYLMMLQVNKKTYPEMEQTYHTILQAQKKMISDFHTLSAEQSIEQTINRMNQLYNTETLLTYLTDILGLDLAEYFHKKIIEEITKKRKAIE